MHFIVATSYADQQNQAPSGSDGYEGQSHGRTVLLARPSHKWPSLAAMRHSDPHTVYNNNNNNNNNIVICKAHKVSSKAESEAPAVVRWAALVGYSKRTVLRRRLKVSAVRESLVSSK